MLSLLVLIAGASVLAIEILAGRMLAPFYGLGPFLRAVLVSVALPALGLGLVVGGRWADRDASPSRLAIPLLLSGAWMVMAPWVRRPLLLALESLGLQTATVVAAILLFGIPWMLLATVPPLVMRRRAAGIDDLGHAVGGVFATFALAAAGAGLLTAFVLVPALGVARTAIALGLVLIGGGLVALRSPQASRATLTAGAALAVLAGLSFWRAGADATPNPRNTGILSLREREEGETRVVMKEGARYLLVDGTIHAVVAPETWSSLNRAPAALEITKRLYPEPGRMLVLGLRGGSIAKSFAKDGWTVRVVEPDSVAVQISNQLFGLFPGEAVVTGAEPREFVRHDDRIYDLILLDTFASNFIPPHLVTREFFGEIAERLGPQGVLAISVETLGWNDPLVTALAATLRTRFESVLALPTGEPPNALGTVVLLAANRKLDVDEDTLPNPHDYLTQPDEHWKVVQMTHGWENRFEPPVQGVRPLTDDWNPSDLRGERINLAARGELHHFFGKRGVSW